MKQTIRIVVAVVVLAAAGVAGWMYFSPSKARVEPTTVTVARGTVSLTVLSTGSLQAQAVTSVGAEVSGRIQTLAVKLGDDVKAGNLIAEIDSVDQQNAVKSAEASLANIRAQLKSKQADLTNAQAALDRATKLESQKLVSDADLMTAQANLATAEAAIEALQAQITQYELAVESAKLDLERTKITAPVSGTVVAVLVSEGQSVNAAQSAPTIVKIADLDTMLIKAQISEADVTRVQPGQSATFTILGDPKTEIPATLLSIEPAPDAIDESDTGISSSDNAIYYNGLFSVANPDHALRIAMTTQVTIKIDEAKDVLTLPASALGTAAPNGLYPVGVYDKASGSIRPAMVKVGLNDNVTAEIVSGLNEGELVISERPAGAPTGAPAGGAPPGGFAGLGGGPPGGGFVIRGG